MRYGELNGLFTFIILVSVTVFFAPPFWYVIVGILWIALLVDLSIQKMITR